MLEAERFPRHHVGESLIDLWRIFSLLEVAEAMDATFQHKYDGILRRRTREYRAGMAL